jgi:mucin-19
VTLLRTGVVMPATAGFNDPLGHPWIVMNDQVSAVNGLSVQNAATGSAVVISVDGVAADTNASLTMQARGAGVLTLGSDTSSVVIKGSSFAFDAPLTLTSTTSPQLTVAYDGSHSLTVGVASNGNVTLTPTGTLTVAGADLHISNAHNLVLEDTTNASNGLLYMDASNRLILKNLVSNGATTIGITGGSGKFTIAAQATIATEVFSVTQAGATTITSAGSSALAVGPNGTTNPALQVDGSASLLVNGVKVTGSPTNNGPTIAAVGSDSAISLNINAKAGGAINLGNAVAITSSSANALTVGLAGSSNPAFKVDASAGSQQNGLVVTGTGGSTAVTVATAGGGTNIPLKIDANGSGVVSIGTVSTGGVTLGGPVSVSTGTFNIQTGGSTTISTGVGVIHMSTANPATNAAWIPISYAGTTYYVPAYTTNSP